jgi:putative transposase
MSRKGNCWHNAVAESFFKTIKYERLNRYNFKSIQEVKKVVFQYIEHWYNRMRLHSFLDYKIPIERETELTTKLKNVA